MRTYAYTIEACDHGSPEEKSRAKLYIKTMLKKITRILSLDDLFKTSLIFCGINQNHGVYHRYHVTKSHDE